MIRWGGELSSLWLGLELIFFFMSNREMRKSSVHRFHFAQPCPKAAGLQPLFWLLLQPSPGQLLMSHSLLHPSSNLHVTDKDLIAGSLCKMKVLEPGPRTRPADSETLDSFLFQCCPHSSACFLCSQNKQVAPASPTEKGGCEG